ncbi:hypothetical protein DESPIG_01082 [Desulfovibrio piger ATCC 29098]|uniref:Uncharacterized protein n=1 Tax=Desulfovibrio piger ATCC 29098 TaxID=411464 RepID=B6WSG0_9BACT|nr:hypothetical protein DESPIG_01082 [Desulfovibrio piger ATCC 29098]
MLFSTANDVKRRTSLQKGMSAFSHAAGWTSAAITHLPPHA